MFSHAAVASLNNLEMMVYHYVIKNRDKVMYMTIRELAEAAGVSTTTVLRFCRKLQCEGYLNFAYVLNYILSRTSLNRQISAPVKS
jgi:DNA-binding MurR/RpiR family transcriptional regulator